MACSTHRVSAPWQACSVGHSVMSTVDDSRKRSQLSWTSPSLVPLSARSKACPVNVVAKWPPCLHWRTARFLLSRACVRGCDVVLPCPLNPTPASCFFTPAMARSCALNAIRYASPMRGSSLAAI